MKQISLRIEVQVNKETGGVSAVYFYIRKGRSARTKELIPGGAYADYDSQGRLIGVELLAPCEVAVLDRITQKEPEPVRNFLRRTIPHAMVA